MLRSAALSKGKWFAWWQWSRSVSTLWRFTTKTVRAYWQNACCFEVMRWRLSSRQWAEHGRLMLTGAISNWGWKHIVYHKQLCLIQWWLSTWPMLTPCRTKFQPFTNICYLSSRCAMSWPMILARAKRLWLACSFLSCCCELMPDGLWWYPLAHWPNNGKTSYLKSLACNLKSSAKKSRNSVQRAIFLPKQIAWFAVWISFPVATSYKKSCVIPTGIWSLSTKRTNSQRTILVTKSIRPSASH